MRFLGPQNKKNPWKDFFANFPEDPESPIRWNQIKNNYYEQQKTTYTIFCWMAVVYAVCVQKEAFKEATPNNDQ